MHTPLMSQFSRQSWDSLNKLSASDHLQMMKQLRIDSLRPGPSGNPAAANAANSDESKATTYTSLPDPLVFKNGTPVQDSDDWQKRRLEILEDFSHEVYGYIPKNLPAVKWEIVSIKDSLINSIPVLVKELLGKADNSSFPDIKVEIQLSLTIPRMIKAPIPVIMEFGFNFPPGWKMPQQNTNEPGWQEQLLSHGWGYAILVPTSFQADNGAGLREGIIGLANKGAPRKPDDWGTLRAWAWGASCAIDYFETDKNVDPKRIGIEGLSRYGKAALVAMAYEPRIAIGFIGSSGAGGAKILRRNFGEQLENLASSGEYHWFAGNFIKYAGPLTPNDLPVDAHELIALCAPRPVFISAGSASVEGTWVDAKGMFLAGLYAEPVYQILGKKGYGIKDFPAEETTLIDGDIAFRQHNGGHTTGPNWPYFIQFAEKYFSDPPK